MPAILVVDDDLVALRILQHVLQKAGYQTQLASSAKEALEWIDIMQFDLAILDISMPYIDGVELLEMIRKNPSYQDTPVIMLTASSLDEDRERAKLAGATLFMTKPLASKDIIDFVKRFL